MATSDKTYYSVAQTAQFVRLALRQSFPGITFAVRSKSYSGGASINVSWTDGPTADAVDAVVGIYQGASFDGMIDLKSYHDAVVMTEDGPKVVHYGADYIFTNRRMSRQMLTRVYGFICRKYGVTPRENALRPDVSSWGAELTHEAGNERLSANDWDRLTVQDAIHREGRRMAFQNGLLIALKG